MQIPQIQIPRWPAFVVSFFVTCAAVAGSGMVIMLLFPDSPLLRTSGDIVGLLTWGITFLAPVLWATFRHPYIAPLGHERIFIVSVRRSKSTYWPTCNEFEYRLSKSPSSAWRELFSSALNGHGNFHKRILFCDSLFSPAFVKKTVEETNSQIDAYLAKKASDQVRAAEEAAAQTELMNANFEQAVNQAGLRAEK